MPDAGNEQALLLAAIAGDRAALDELLLDHYEQVAAHVARRMPLAIQGAISSDDIVQETFVHVIRDVGNFRPHNDQSFLAWIKRIAEHRIHDATRYAERQKRGGGRQARREPGEIREDRQNPAHG